MIKKINLKYVGIKSRIFESGGITRRVIIPEESMVLSRLVLETGSFFGDCFATPLSKIHDFMSEAHT
jgi:hypothetical protein